MVNIAPSGQVNIKSGNKAKNETIHVDGLGDVDTDVYTFTKGNSTITLNYYTKLKISLKSVESVHGATDIIKVYDTSVKAFEKEIP